MRGCGEDMVGSFAEEGDSDACFDFPVIRKNGVIY